MAGVLGEPPFVLGWDVSGVVEAVGFGVHTLNAGDEVFGMPWFPRRAGAYAEYVTAPSRQFARKPAGVGHDAAAAVPLAALTAWQTLEDAAELRAGQRVLVHAAAGGVGHFAVQIAHHLGAHVIAPRAPPSTTGCVNSAPTRSSTTPRSASRTWSVTWTSSSTWSATATTTTAPARWRPCAPADCSSPYLPACRPNSSNGPGSGAARATAYLVEPDGHALGEIARLIGSDALSVEVEEVFLLEDAAAAHRHIESGRTRGKLVLRVAP